MKPCIGKRTNKFIKIPKQYNINTGIKNDLPLLNQINNNKTETISMVYTNSPVNNAT